MSIANPLTVIGSLGSYSCARINQDSYGSEYFGRLATGEMTLKIRHSKVTNPDVYGNTYERHNVELRETVYAVTDVPQYENLNYAVLQHKRGATSAAVVDAGEALVDFLDDTHLADLYNWIS